MKKKLLSLVLAGAMVASTSVSAFADDTIQVEHNSENKIEVPIKGDIAASDGTTLPGSITVTVPTSAAFKVDKEGNLTSPPMSVVNKGDAAVSVIASKFVDASGDKRINLVKEVTGLEDSDRNKVYLMLTGGDRDVVLTSESNGDDKPAGKMYDVRDTSREIEENDNFVIKKVNASSTATLTLKGKGTAYNGTNTGEAVNDSFRLVLKIKQDR